MSNNNIDRTRFLHRVTKIIVLLVLVMAVPLAKAGGEGEVVEGEKINVISVSGGNTSIQQTSLYGWRSEAQLFWSGAKAGDILVVELPVANAGEYNLLAQFSRANDYGIVKLFLDGEPLGETIDLYSPSVVIKPMLLGKRTLSAGTHLLTIEIAGKNDFSSGSYFGLDYLNILDSKLSVEEVLAPSLKPNAELADRLGVRRNDICRSSA